MSELKTVKNYSFATDVSPVQVNLASDVQEYRILGTKVLAGNYVVTVTGTAVEGMNLWLWYDGTNLTLGGNSVTVWGVTLPDRHAVLKLIFLAQYKGGGWETRYWLDNNVSLWIHKEDLNASAYDDATIENDGTNGLQLKDDGITNAKVKTTAAIAYSKLALTDEIVDSDIKTTAQIAWTKMLDLTANRALYADASGDVTVSAVTDTELGYVSGAASNLQTQITARITTGVAAIVDADVNGAAAIGYAKLNLVGLVDNADIAAAAAVAWSKMANLTASRLLVSDGSGDVSVSAVTSTETAYLSGVTSAIQTQIDALDSDVESYVSIAADTTLDSTTIKKNIQIDTTGGHVQVTLPATSTLTLGQKVEFSQIKANNGTMAANGADDIVDKDGTAGNATYPAVSMGTGGMIHILYSAAFTWSVILEI